VLQDVRGRGAVWTDAGDLARTLETLAAFLAVYESPTARGAVPAAVPPAAWHEIAPPAAPPDDWQPFVLDPGDLRPENIVVADERVVLVDFENAAVRRRSAVLAGLLGNLGGRTAAPATLVVARAYGAAVAR